MQVIEEVEALGGMTKCIESGMAKLRIEESATKKQARIDTVQEVVVGVNKYRKDNNNSSSSGSQVDVEVLKIDNTQVRIRQIERLTRCKAERDSTAVAEALTKLTEVAKDSNTPATDLQNNLLQLCVEAARKNATLGEISAALEAAWGRHVASTQVVQGAYSASFNSQGNEEAEFTQVQGLIREFAEKSGRRPRLLVAKMGQDGHDRGAKVIASGFADLGFDIDVGPLFSTPEEVARQAIDADVHCVGVSSQAAGHGTLVPALIKELKAQGGEKITVVVGGVVPPQDYPELEKAGVAAVFGPGTRITDAAKQVLKSIRNTD